MQIILIWSVYVICVCWNITLYPINLTIIIMLIKSWKKYFPPKKLISYSKNNEKVTECLKCSGLDKGEWKKEVGIVIRKTVEWIWHNFPVYIYEYTTVNLNIMYIHKCGILIRIRDSPCLYKYIKIRLGR